MMLFHFNRLRLHFHRDYWSKSIINTYVHVSVRGCTIHTHIHIIVHITTYGTGHTAIHYRVHTIIHRIIHIRGM